MGGDKSDERRRAKDSHIITIVMDLDDCYCGLCEGEVKFSIVHGSFRVVYCEQCCFGICRATTEDAVAEFKRISKNLSKLSRRQLFYYLKRKEQRLLRGLLSIRKKSSCVFDSWEEFKRRDVCELMGEKEEEENGN